MKHAICHPEMRYHAKGMCKACYQQRWAEENRDKTKDAHLRYRLNNPEKVKVRSIANYRRFREYIRNYRKMRNAEPRIRRDHKNRKLINRYGISLAQYEELLVLQGGACAICGRTDGFGGVGHNLRVDHDHRWNVARGLLCNRCNTGLGYMENEEWYNKACSYLKQYDELRQLKLSRG